MNRAVANDLNHPELKLWWMYLGCLPHGLVTVLILFLIYVHIYGWCLIKEINFTCRNIDTRLRWFPFVGLYRHLGQRQKCFFTPMNQSWLPDRLIKGHNYFPWDLSICPSLTAGGGNCFPTLGKCRRFWLLPPILRDPWAVSYYQLPAPTPRTHRKHRADQNLAQVQSQSFSQDQSQQTECRCGLPQTVKKKLVKYFRPKYLGYFSPSVRWEKPFICSRTETK